MEESKYYVPELEEFHPSFEYEFLSYGQEFVKTEVCDTGEFFKGEKRVKYLDREDIEDLGFVKGYGPWWNHPEKNIQLGYGDCYKLGDAVITKGMVKGELIYVFRGTIKNKSELRRLMKMLGI